MQRVASGGWLRQEGGRRGSGGASVTGSLRCLCNIWADERALPTRHREASGDESEIDANLMDH